MHGACSLMKKAACFYYDYFKHGTQAVLGVNSCTPHSAEMIIEL